MISLSTAERALKEVYLGVIRNHLDCYVDPFLAKLTKTHSHVFGAAISLEPEWACKYKDVPHITSRLKDMKGYIEVSDKAIRISENSTGAFVNFLNSEVERMLNTFKVDIHSSLYGKSDSIKITSLPEIFSNSSELYGLSRKAYKELKVKVKKVDSFDPKHIDRIVEENDHIDFIIASKEVVNVYRDYMIDHNQDVARQKLSDGTNAIFVNKSVPMVMSKMMNPKEVYFICTQDFAMHMLCDWMWVENEEGKILRQIPERPVYRADLVKYADIICSNPYKQIKLIIKEM